MVGRYQLDKKLWEADIVHGWMGAALIALEQNESTIDDIVDKVETEFRPTLDPELPLMEYALDDYPGEARDQITRRLDLVGVPYQIGSDLVMIVHERDEEMVDEVFEKMVSGDSEIPTFGPGVEGVDPHLLIEKLFNASDRLRRNPQDAKAKAMFLEVNDVIFDMSLPWGYDAFFWKSILDQVVHLYEIFETDDVDDEEDGDDIASGATEAPGEGVTADNGTTPVENADVSSDGPGEVDDNG